MIVTADYQSIQWESTLTFKVHVNNPLDPNSSISITMSDDFTVPSAFETITIKTIDDTSAEAYPLCGSPAATTVAVRPNLLRHSVSCRATVCGRVEISGKCWD